VLLRWESSVRKEKENFPREKINRLFCKVQGNRRSTQIKAMDRKNSPALKKIMYSYKL